MQGDSDAALLLQFLSLNKYQQTWSPEAKKEKKKYCEILCNFISQNTEYLDKLCWPALYKQFKIVFPQL